MLNLAEGLQHLAENLLKLLPVWVLNLALAALVAPGVPQACPDLPLVRLSTPCNATSSTSIIALKMPFIIIIFLSLLPAPARRDAPGQGEGLDSEALDRDSPPRDQGEGSLPGNATPQRIPDRIHPRRCVTEVLGRFLMLLKFSNTFGSC